MREKLRTGFRIEIGEKLAELDMFVCEIQYPTAKMQMHCFSPDFMYSRISPTLRDTPH